MKTTTDTIPPQHQDTMPGRETPLTPQPLEKGDWYRGSGKLMDKIAVITGGDSGIGRSVALFFAKEGADTAVIYLNEHEDAEKTKKMIEELGRRCILLPGDVSDSGFCARAIEKTIDEFGRLDILVNNAALQFFDDNLETLSDAQIEKTFRTNIFSYFYMAREALKYLKAGSAIINTTSVTAYRGSPRLLDYAASKGAIVAFTRSLAGNLVKRGIRVNGVAPGPVWTPLAPATFKEEDIPEFGKKVPMQRVGQPEEVAASYVFLASRDSSYMTGQVLHPNGGEIING
jgi:NAD(P)-dependent dehydrogenase (short-subunit alcohol dehydrogenase family)